MLYSLLRYVTCMYGGNRSNRSRKRSITCGSYLNYCSPAVEEYLRTRNSTLHICCYFMHNPTCSFNAHSCAQICSSTLCCYCSTQFSIALMDYSKSPVVNNLKLALSLANSSLCFAHFVWSGDATGSAIQTPSCAVLVWL